MKLAGVIYLYEISQTRISSDQEPLRMLRGTVNIVVATTKWGNPVEDIECKRENQLSQWQLTLARFENSAESAWHIVHQILENKPDDPLELLDSLIKRLESEEPRDGRSLKPIQRILDQVRKVFSHR